MSPGQVSENHQAVDMNVHPTVQDQKKRASNEARFWFSGQEEIGRGRFYSESVFRGEL
jgi:hypothetical protein